MALPASASFVGAGAGQVMMGAGPVHVKDSPLLLQQIDAMQLSIKHLKNENNRLKVRRAKRPAWPPGFVQSGNVLGLQARETCPSPGTVTRAGLLQPLSSNKQTGRSIGSRLLNSGAPISMEQLVGADSVGAALIAQPGGQSGQPSLVLLPSPGSADAEGVGLAARAAGSQAHTAQGQARGGGGLWFSVPQDKPFAGDPLPDECQRQSGGHHPAEDRCGWGELGGGKVVQYFPPPIGLGSSGLCPPPLLTALLPPAAASPAAQLLEQTARLKQLSETIEKLKVTPAAAILLFLAVPAAPLLDPVGCLFPYLWPALALSSQRM